MIRSILDNDLYKFTMQQAVHVLYPRAMAKYVFINRAGTIFPDGFANRLSAEIKKMESLRLTDEELSYLKDRCYFLTPVYLDFLRHYRYDSGEVKVAVENGSLSIGVEGPWFRTILWEVPLMAMVSELYFEMTKPSIESKEQQIINNIAKTTSLRNANVKFADFGTRRRFSALTQENLLRDILSVKGNTLTGTSNVYFAMKFNIKPIGTHAHEWFMFHAAQNGYRLANKTALDNWINVYKGNLGIALTDTYTTDTFLQAFNSVNARLFDGVRHDSGDPVSFTDKMVNHYRELRIDPMTKTIVFSDGLNVSEAIRIRQYCEGKINSSFGIGTTLTNDIGPKALNMVIKLSECCSHVNSPWIPVVKLSDVEGKHTGTKDELDLCIRTTKRSSI
ncbi:MAG: nicotinate phosphoribosyltransferase [Deltaproteobacteria bacterium]|nr:nicotinate phosphoribosyltransferase [Deltaproteobacteria bacterium]